MSDYLPPSETEARQNNDPAWLRNQANLIKQQAQGLADALEKRAELLEVNHRMGELRQESLKIKRALGE
jgi:transposase